MAETIEQKAQRLEKLRAQQAALLEKAKAVQKRISRAQSAEKTKRKKQDDRTKTLLGVAIIYAAQKNPQLISVLKEAIKGMTPKDQGFLTQESELWADLRGDPKPAVQSVAAQPPQASAPQTGFRGQTEMGELVMRAAQRTNDLSKKP